MARKNDTTVYLLIGAAVVGYLAYKKGIFTKGVIPGSPAVPPAGLQSTSNVATELPSLADTGIIAPKIVDVTGMQLDFLN